MSQIEHLVTDVVSGHSFSCRRGETLLDSATRHGANLIRIGCRAGGCGMCKVQVVCGSYQTGPMSRAHVSEAEEAEGFVLACRTLPDANLEFRSIDKRELSDSRDQEVRA